MSGEPTELTYSSDLKEWLNNNFKEINFNFQKARVEESRLKKGADNTFTLAEAELDRLSSSLSTAKTVNMCTPIY